MGLLYLIVGLACGVAVGMGIKRREGSSIDEPTTASPHETDAGKPPAPPRFPDVEYDLESEEP